MSCDERPHIGTKEPMEGGKALADDRKALVSRH